MWSALETFTAVKKKTAGGKSMTVDPQAVERVGWLCRKSSIQKRGSIHGKRGKGEIQGETSTDGLPMEHRLHG